MYKYIMYICISLCAHVSSCAACNYMQSNHAIEDPVSAEFAQALGRSWKDLLPSVPIFPLASHII